MNSDIMFSIVPSIILIGFVIVMFFFLFTIVKSIGEWKYNNKQPVLTVDANLVAKRTNTSTTSHTNQDGISSHETTSTTYYITFQVESGSRIEFRVRGNEFGMLAEGDRGKLTFQGTRYLSFQRDYDA